MQKYSTQGRGVCEVGGGGGSFAQSLREPGDMQAIWQHAKHLTSLTIDLKGNFYLLRSRSGG